MGNNECLRCISAEKEMFAEVLLGKDKSKNKSDQNINTNTNNNLNTSKTNSNIKQIHEELPKDILILIIIIIIPN